MDSTKALIERLRARADWLAEYPRNRLKDAKLMDEAAVALSAQGEAAQPAAEDWVLVPREPTDEHLRALFTMNSALPRTTDEAKGVYSALLNISEAQRAASPNAASQDGGRE